MTCSNNDGTLEGVPCGWNRFGFELRNEPRGTRILVAGELDLVTTPALRQVLDYLERERRGVCIDLKALDFMDSVGLAAIHLAWRAAETSGRRLTVRGCSRQVERLFQITGMRDLLPFED